MAASSRPGGRYGSRNRMLLQGHSLNFTQEAGQSSQLELYPGSRASKQGKILSFQSLPQLHTSISSAVPSKPSYTVPPTGDKVFKNMPKWHILIQNTTKTEILNLSWFLKKMKVFYLCACVCMCVPEETSGSPGAGSHHEPSSVGAGE